MREIKGEIQEEGENWGENISKTGEKANLKSQKNNKTKKLLDESWKKTIL